MKKLLLFLTYLFFTVSGIATNPTLGLVYNKLEASYVQAEDEMRLGFYNELRTNGHLEFVARVIGTSDLEPQGPYTYSWSIDGYPDSATMYIWPRGAGQGSVADVSIYYTSSGAANVKCMVYKNGTCLKTLYGFASF